MAIISRSMLYFLTIFFISLFFSSYHDFKFDTVGASFVFTTTQSLLLLCVVGPWCFNLVKVYFTFSFIFLALIPWFHYSQAVVLWGGRGFSQTDYLWANLVVFLTNCVVAATYLYVYRRNSVSFLIKSFLSVFGGRKQERGKAWSLIGLAGIGLFGVLFLNGFSLSSLFFKGLVADAMDAPMESSALKLMFNMLFRLIPFFCFIYAFLSARVGALAKSLLFIFVVLTVFPTGVSRYMVAFVYIPIVLLLFPKLRAGFVFPLLLVFSIFFIFPFLDQFRNARELDDLALLPSLDFFVAGHFDAYQNLMRVIQSDLVTFGQQLLGVALFFVPRDFWPDKPVGSGYFLSEVEGYEFSNISMPFIGEGYINFGLIGALLFSGLLSAVLAELDKYFDMTNSIKYSRGYSEGIYLYLCGALMFVLRGDLLSSFAYVVSGVVAAWIVLVVVRLSR